MSRGACRQRVPLITSQEYVLRYAPDVVWDGPSLLAALQVDGADGVGDALEWDHYVEMEDEAVMLREGTLGTGLARSGPESRGDDGHGLPFPRRRVVAG